ncbi:hypothetical protein [Rhizobium bangladeshense]|uniref:hypothetical protein n=1 Tax=Rhizobium bangladeshense TaxID=1138189 RepID=UPI001C83F347|nr:hypothetical protein [Rhizobium bangladeshense]MBX4896830.1 hypothetical protein [Rhizobium bangladeshense]MBX4900371.1 hypothetical protein [Rhizobium bangladeshense]MBX4912572.1 hypothetical protein [Rhizobium bangladeshense]MBY3611883.1 hypothetical protein [Rhizobium bangladeshense]
MTSSREPRTIKWSTPIVALLISIISTGIAALSLYLARDKEITVNLKGATRDWQRGAIFSTLLASPTPMTIDDIETKYRTDASAYRDRFHLTDANFSREEIYGVLLELINGQAIRLRDNKYFSVRADDDTLQDRRIAFDMLEFVLQNEYKYQYDEFASQFANWYSKNKGNSLSKDRALGVLAVAIQSNLLGLRVQLGFRFDCIAIGDVPPLFVTSNFAVRTGAPVALPMPGTLPPCPPKP